MSYVAFDLDALNRAPNVARAIGCTEDTIVAGLVRLWAYCFREAKEVVSEAEIKGLFGIDAKDALVAFGFLAAMENAFRVKGADRYLRYKKGVKSGGLASKKNLKQYQKKAQPKKEGEPEESRNGAGGGAGGEPEIITGSPSGFDPALTPNTYKETSNDVSFITAQAPKKKKALKGKAQEVAQEHFTGVPWQVAVEQLFSAFERFRGAKYTPTARDFSALENLAKRTRGDFAEVSRRWTNALRSGFPIIGELWQLEQKFNQFAANPEAPKPQAQAADPNQGILRQPAKIDVCAICAGGAEFKVWGRPMCAQHRAQWDESEMLDERETAAWVEAERLLP